MRIEGENKQNIFGDWQLDIIKVKSDPTFFSGDLQLVIETEKPKRWITNHQVNHQSPGESPGESPITKKKGKNPFLCESPITNHQKSESWLKIRGSIATWLFLAFLLWPLTIAQVKKIYAKGLDSKFEFFLNCFLEAGPLTSFQFLYCKNIIMLSDWQFLNVSSSPKSSQNILFN